MLIAKGANRFADLRELERGPGETLAFVADTNSDNYEIRSKAVPKGSTVDRDGMLQEYSSAAKDGRYAVISFEGPGFDPSMHRFELDLSTLRRQVIPVFNVSLNTNRSLSLAGGDVRNITANQGWLSLSKVRAFRVEIQPGLRWLEIRDSEIAHLVFTKPVKGCDIELVDSEILRLDIPPGFQCRDFRLKGTRFSAEAERAKDGKLLEAEAFAGTRENPILDRQSYSDLQTWATGVGNSEVAHIARATELSIEHTYARGWDRFLLWVWKYLGGFGLSVGRPLAWLAGSSVVYFFLIFCLGTTGWSGADGSTVLMGDGLGNQVSRALVATLQNIVSPWSAFGARRLVTAATTPGLWFSVFHAVFSAVSILFAGFSVRRRFRFS